MRYPVLPRPEWFKTVKQGDVLETPSGDMRLVRRVHRIGPERFYLTFAIRHCSWTKRPYTVKYHADADLRHWKYIGPYRGRLTAVDFRIQQEIDDWERNGTHRRFAKCCEARGLP